MRWEFSLFVKQEETPFVLFFFILKKEKKVERKLEKRGGEKNGKLRMTIPINLFSLDRPTICIFSFLIFRRKSINARL